MGTRSTCPTRRHGALAAGQAFDARDFLAALAPAGIEVAFGTGAQAETPVAAA